MNMSEGDVNLPSSWYAQIEKTREKARKFLKKVVVVDLNDSILIGILDDVSLDKLFRLQYPFCKLTIKRYKKYSSEGKLEKQEEGEQICFVNKPQMILDMQELSSRFPEIYEDIHIEIKKGVY